MLQRRSGACASFLHHLGGEVIGWCSFLPCPARNDPVLHCEVPRRLDGAVELRPASSAAPLDSSSPRSALPLVGALERQNILIHVQFSPTLAIYYIERGTLTLLSTRGRVKWRLQVRPSSRERLGSCPWALWVRMLHRERRSLRQEAISTCSLCVSRAPAGCRAEEAWLVFLCSGSFICSCRVRFCSISSWFCADSWNIVQCQAIFDKVLCVPY